MKRKARTERPTHPKEEFKRRKEMEHESEIFGDEEFETYLSHPSKQVFGKSFQYGEDNFHWFTADKKFKILVFELPPWMHMGTDLSEILSQILRTNFYDKTLLEKFPIVITSYRRRRCSIGSFFSASVLPNVQRFFLLYPNRRGWQPRDNSYGRQ